MGDLNGAEPLEQSSTKNACRILYRKQSAAGAFHFKGCLSPISWLFTGRGRDAIPERLLYAA